LICLKGFFRWAFLRLEFSAGKKIAPLSNTKAQYAKRTDRHLMMYREALVL